MRLAAARCEPPLITLGSSARKTSGGATRARAWHEMRTNGRPTKHGRRRWQLLKSLLRIRRPRSAAEAILSVASAAGPVPGAVVSAARPRAVALRHLVVHGTAAAGPLLRRRRRRPGLVALLGRGPGGLWLPLPNMPAPIHASGQRATSKRKNIQRQARRGVRGRAGRGERPRQRQDHRRRRPRCAMVCPPGRRAASLTLRAQARYAARRRRRR